MNLTFNNSASKSKMITDNNDMNFAPYNSMQKLDSVKNKWNQVIKNKEAVIQDRHKAMKD